MFCPSYSIIGYVTVADAAVTADVTAAVAAVVVTVATVAAAVTAYLVVIGNGLLAS